MATRTKKSKKRNLMLIGASGGVANAVLHYMRNYRGLFGKLVLVDKNRKVLKDKYLDHRHLDYTFIHENIKLPSEEKTYLDLLKKHAIDIVLDLTDMASIEILQATDKAGVSYVNTAMNDEKKTVKELVYDVVPRKRFFSGAPHILCTGMNPGNVNMWVRHGIATYGRPKQVVHFEYDTSTPAKGWESMMTWSIHEFLVESVRDPSGIALGRGKIKPLYPNALENQVPLKPVLGPIMPVEKHASGFTVLHEENLSISYKYDIPSKFIYAVNQHTMKHLVRLYEKNRNVYRKQLEMGDNTHEFLQGADNIGVFLDYPDKRVYFFNSVPNMGVIGTNATYTQVAVGVFAALYVLLFDKLEPGAYFVEDLYDTHYKYFMFDNLRVQEFVFKKGKNGLRLTHYLPAVVMRRQDRFDHFYLL